MGIISFQVKIPYVPPVDVTGTLWTWGRNNYGQLGQGNTINYSSPVQLGLLTTWEQFSTSSYDCLAIKENTLWAWGLNEQGSLGLNDRVSRSSPVQVGVLSDWSKVSSGGRHTIALKTDGTIWTWGYNFYGDLGIGTGGSGTYKSSPVQVGSLTDWSKVDARTNNCVALKTDGTLWAWGRNEFGQLGLGDIIHRSSPVQIGALTNWSDFDLGDDQTLAIKTDGTLWVWGRNNNGQLGDGTIVDKSSPVQIGSDTNWSWVAGANGWSVAIKSDGTIWSWGGDFDGHLGHGTVNVHLSSPVQIGSLTDWSKVEASVTITIATKTDGTLWAWGVNSYGSLGQDNTTNYSSPIQVGLLEDWDDAGCGTYHAMGLRQI